LQVLESSAFERKRSFFTIGDDPAPEDYRTCHGQFATGGTLVGHPHKKSSTAMNERDQTLWYKNAVFYGLDVATFQDSNGDGIGDFPGLMSRLDYVADLGVTCLWLLPFFPSLNRDNGYDVTDYFGVDPRLGTFDEFRTFVHEAGASRIDRSRHGPHIRRTSLVSSRSAGSRLPLSALLHMDGQSPAA
jgi:hypothetical protein